MNTFTSQWDAFYHHIYRMDREVLHPAEKIGLQIDLKALEVFTEDLRIKTEELVSLIQAEVPAEILVTTVKKKQPKEDGYVEEVIETSSQSCLTCNATDVSIKHRCDKQCEVCGKIVSKVRKTCPECRSKFLLAPTPKVAIVIAPVTRWTRIEPFNPASPLQVLSYIDHFKHKAGRGKQNTEDKALNALYAKYKDKFYSLLQDHREVSKVYGTYAKGTFQHLDRNNCIHPQFQHKPSTLRLSCQNPNIQNVVSDKGGDDGPAAGFKKTIVARPGCVFVEADYSALEAVLTGWFANDPGYIKIARLGVHARLTADMVNQPVDDSWQESDMLEHFGMLKKKYPQEYARAKRVVHGTSYGMSAIGLVNNYPDLFNRASAARIQGKLFSLAPKVKQWHDDLRQLAAKNNYLGGKQHPFHYKHYFWNVYNYSKATEKYSLGHDAKRLIAFFPQSTGMGILAECCLVLANPASETYIGDMWEGQTPIRALIHDSILSEVPEEKLDIYLTKVHKQMTAPIPQLPLPPEWEMGEYLSIGCEIKIGKNWGEMEVVR